MGVVRMWVWVRVVVAEGECFELGDLATFAPSTFSRRAPPGEQPLGTNA